MARRISSCLQQAFLYCWFAVFLILSLECGYLTFRRAYVFLYPLVPLLYFALAVWMCSVFSSPIPSRVFSWLSRVCIFACFLLCMFFNTQMRLPPMSDCAMIFDAVSDIVTNGHVAASSGDPLCGANIYSLGREHVNDYFMVYHASLFPVCFLVPCFSLIHAFFGIIPNSAAGYLSAAVFNSAMITLSVYLAFKIVYKLRGDLAAFAFLLLSLGFVQYYLNSDRLYTDTLSLPFVSASLYLFVISEEKSGTNRVLLGVLCGFVCALGILIKGSLGVVLVAITIYILLSSDKTRFRLLSGILAGAVSVLLVWSFVSYRLPWFDYTNSDRYELPLTHWIMMGSAGDGTYMPEDLDYSLSFETKDEKNQAAVSEISRRISSCFSPESSISYPKFVARKLSHLLNGAYANQYNYDRLDNSGLLYDFVHTDGRYFSYFQLIYRFSIFSSSFAILFNTAVTIRRKSLNISFLFELCIFGALLFFAFWEANARYMLSFTVIFNMLSAFTVDDITQIISRRCERKSV